MKQELEQRLADRYPFLQRRQNAAEQKATKGYIYNLYWAFGCEHSSGWFQLLWNLCAEIEALYMEAGLPIDIEVQQIKEKFGSLRFYYSIGDFDGPHAIDLLGSGCIRRMPEDTDLQRRIADVVSKYEDRSKTVCEWCGKPGTLRKDLRRILTLCDCCYKMQSEKNV